MFQRIITSCLLLVCCTLARAADSYTVTVAAAERDRIATPITFTLPDNPPDAVWHLMSPKDAKIPVHVSGRQAVFILDHLPANKTATYTMQRGEVRPAGITLLRQGDVVKISTADKPILTYQGAPMTPPAGVGAEFTRGGYLHPVFTPSGKLVTDDFPADHRHHHGIWSPWTLTEFEGRKPDFWNMGKKSGRVDFVAIDLTYSNPVCAGFRTRHRMIDMSAKPEKAAINETWDVRVYAPASGGGKPMYIFDLMIEQTCASESPLILPKYHYGGLGYRGARQWKDIKGNCFFLTSEGKDRSNGNETTGRWCHVSGKVDGEMAGVAIFDHPENFRSPQPMRLNPSDPFFCYAPSQGGDWKIEPGKPYVAKYRFVVSDGGADKAEIERLWNDWGNPPKVTVR